MKDPKTTIVAIANFAVLLVLIIGYFIEKITIGQIQEILTITGTLSIVVLGYFARDSKKQEE
jgi:hypothetical protein